MIEIIPNWHPFFVHFTVGLLSTAVLFYWATIFLPDKHPWKKQWSNMANWCLWSGGLFTVATAAAGWFAYNSVAHDTASHAAMTVHRNWALPTATTFLLMGLWTIMLARKERQPGFWFLSLATGAAVMLAITGWLGAEVVYRYGAGVMSLPNVEGHNHSHGAMQNDAGETEHNHAETKVDHGAMQNGVGESEHNHAATEVDHGTSSAEPAKAPLKQDKSAEINAAPSHHHSHEQVKRHTHSHTH